MLALVALAVTLVAGRAEAASAVIDFEAIPVGTGLPPLAGPDNDINEFLPPGITLTSAAPGSVMVGEGVGGNHFLIVHLTGLGADALVNLGYAAETVAIDFLLVPEARSAASTPSAPSRTRTRWSSPPGSDRTLLGAAPARPRSPRRFRTSVPHGSSTAEVPGTSS